MISFEEVVSGYEAAHRAADSARKREFIRAEALRREQPIEELCGLLRSTYAPGAREAAEEAERARAAARAAEAAELARTPAGVELGDPDFGADFEEETRSEEELDLEAHDLNEQAAADPVPYNEFPEGF